MINHYEPVYIILSVLLPASHLSSAFISDVFHVSNSFKASATGLLVLANAIHMGLDFETILTDN